jgi:hypothetical protein
MERAMVDSGNVATSGPKIGRRDVLRYGAFAGATAAIGSSVGVATTAQAGERRRVLPAPKPIPGGLAPGIHVWAPGPPEITLPFSGVQLQGLDVDPSVITDRSGFTALAFHAGTATGSDGKRYNLETDMRAFRGSYLATDGTMQHGAFGFV